MIIFVTSVSVRYERLRAHTEMLCAQHEGARVITLDRGASHLEQADEVDKLLAANGGIVFCPSDSELALLRLMKLVRTKTLAPVDLDIVCLTKEGGEMSIRLDEAGEFIDQWPEGFFMGRMAELFE